MNFNKTLAVAMLAGSLLTSSSAFAANPYANVDLVLGQNLFISPSPTEVYPSLSGSITITLTEYAENELQRLTIKAPDGSTTRTSKFNEKVDGKEFVYDLTAPLTQEGVYTISLDERSFYYDDVHYNTKYVIEYTIGQPQVDYTLTPEPGDVSSLSTVSISFGNSTLGLTASASAKFVTSNGVEYPASISTGANGSIVVTANNALPYENINLVVAGGSVTINGTVFNDEIKGYYNNLSPEPVFTATVTPANGVVTSLNTFSIKWTDEKGKPYQATINGNAPLSDYPRIYYVLENGSRMQVATGSNLAYLNDGNAWVNPDPDASIAVPPFDELQFIVPEITTPGHYVLTIPEGLLKWGDLSMHHEVEYGEWTIEKTGDFNYGYTVTPATGSTIATLEPLKISFTGVAKVETDYTRNFQVYYTNSNNQRTAVAGYRAYVDENGLDFIVDLDGGGFTMRDLGKYEFVFPAGYFKFFSAADDTTPVGVSDLIATQFDYYYDRQVYSGVYNVEKQAGSWNFKISYDNNSIVEYGSEGIKLLDPNGKEVEAKRSLYLNSNNYVDLRFTPFGPQPAGTYTLVVPEGYFVVNGDLSPAINYTFSSIGVNYTLTTNPANGAVVNNLSKLTFTLAGSISAEYDEIKYASISVMHTDQFGTKTKLADYECTYSNMKFELVPQEKIFLPGSYTVSIPRGTFIVSNANGEGVLSDMVMLNFEVEAVQYTGGCEIKRNDSAWQFNVSFDNATSLIIYNTSGKVRLLNENGALVSDNCTVSVNSDNNTAVLTFNDDLSKFTDYKYTIDIADMKFLVNGCYTPAIVKNFEILPFAGNYTITRVEGLLQFNIVFDGAKSLSNFITSNPVALLDGAGNLISDSSVVSLNYVDNSVSVTFVDIDDISADAYVLQIPEARLMIDGCYNPPIRKEFKATGIADIMAEGADTGVYTLSGIKVKKDNLAPGTYIMRRGDKSVKVIIR